MTKGLDSVAACGARLRASAGQGCGPHGSKEPKNDATTFVQKPLFRILRRIPISDCFSAPAAGYRNWSAGDLGSVGYEGDIWSATTLDVGRAGASFLSFHATRVYPLCGWYRASGYSVRCVQHLHDCFLLLGIGSGTTFRSENKNPLPIIKARDVFERLASALERQVVRIVSRHSRCRSGCRLGRCCCRSRSRITGRSGVRCHGSNSGLLSV